MRNVLHELLSRWEATDSIGVPAVVATFRSVPPAAGGVELAGQQVKRSGSCAEGWSSPSRGHWAAHVLDTLRRGWASARRCGTGTRPAARILRRSG